MYIYKITVIPLNQVYIGMDTKPIYKKSRWKDHCRASKKETTRKIHLAMKKYGIENCVFEVIEDGFSTLGELALAEIRYIEQYNSYKNGLNSSRGGDGLGHKNWNSLSEDEIKNIKSALGDHFKDYNKKKWANTSPEQRKEMVKNAFTPEVNKRRANSLKEYYKATPESVDYKIKKILQWQQENKELHRSIARKNGLKGSETVSKEIVVEKEDGSVLHFKSKSEFNRLTGQWASTIIRKTSDGSFYNGYRIKEIT